MNTIKNAISALKRNLGRNIFISLIMFVIISISCISLIINNTAESIAKEQKDKFGSKVTIQYSEEALMNDMKQSNGGEIMTFGRNVLDPKLLQNISKSEYIMDTIFSSGFGADSPQLKAVKSDNNSVSLQGSSSSISSIGGEQAKMPDFQIQGYSANQEEGVLTQSNQKLLEGKLPSSPLECMISDKLAKENNLNIGDSFTLKPVSYDEKNQSPSDMEVVISGLYVEVPSSNDGAMFTQFSQDNNIYMLYEAMVDESYHIESFLNATYYLKSPDDLDAFTKEARALGLGDEYEVTTDKFSYQQVVGPIDSMSSMSMLFLSVVLILGGAILILLTILNIRERNYEIGILRSLGMKKYKVILQMIMEPAILMAMMLVIGCGVGSVIAQPISDALLAKQIETGNNPQSGGNIMISSSINIGGSNTETIKEMDVSMDLTSFLQLFGVAALLVIISGLVSSIYIVKYEPMQILSERR